MKFLAVSALLFVAVSGAPQNYGYGGSGGGGVGGGFSGGVGGIVGGGVSLHGGGRGGVSKYGCSNGEVLNADGSCATPKLTTQVYVYAAPPQPAVYGPPPKIPQPEKHSNIIFIRAPEHAPQKDPIIVGPPQVNNVVYVLAKRPTNQGQKVIQVPAQAPKSPQVYFLHYGDGENPQLPGGIDLNTALKSASSAGGQLIGDLGGHGGGGLGGVGGGIGGGVVGGGIGIGGGDYDSVEVGYQAPQDIYQAPQPSGLYSTP